MLQERDTSLCERSGGQGVAPRKSSHYFASTFITRLMNLGKGGSRQYDYPGVRRWTRKFDVFAKRRVYMPVNINNTHWTLLMVDIEKRYITFYDSMNGSGQM